MRQIFIEVGQEGRAILPWSEVCLHMGVADLGMRFVIVGKAHPMVQLLNEDGSPRSFPITLGEAGIFQKGGRMYYYV